ncbi:hypothetical protein STENM223S_08583 [Streptomyces tendae]
MSPAPGVGDQRASFRLHVALDAAARAGAPVEILEGVSVAWLFGRAGDLGLAAMPRYRRRP